MAWQPDGELLQQVVQLFQQSEVHNRDVQQSVLQQLEQFSQHPEFTNYLCYMFASADNVNLELRLRAGLYLKQYYVAALSTGATVTDYVKSALLASLGHSDAQIRRIAGIIITTILSSSEGYDLWPNAIHAICERLKGTDEAAFNGALAALNIICEDTAADICMLEDGHLSVVVIEVLLSIAGANFPADTKRVALDTLNHFVLCFPPALDERLDQYVSCLQGLSSDSNPATRKVVCVGIVALVTVAANRLQSNFGSIVEYIIKCCQDENIDVALEATEFWSIVVGNEIPSEVICPYLPRVVPILLQNMVYSQEELAMLAAEVEESEEVEDREQDIRPHVHHGKVMGGGDEDEDEDEDEDTGEDEWTLRKCSASALDTLACYYGPYVLPTLMPLLEQRLGSDDWLQHEAAVLAIGAIAEGCFELVKPHLRKLIPFLFNYLSSSMPLLRSITCWSISRYSRWITGREGEKEKAEREAGGAGQGDRESQSPLPEEAFEAFYKPAMHGVMMCAADKLKKVQEAGCSAVATIEEAAGDMLAPLVEDLCNLFASCLSRYRAKNLLILYDAISTFAASSKSTFQQPIVLERVVKPVVEKWLSSLEGTPAFSSATECIVSIIKSIGAGFAPFAQVTVKKVVGSLETSFIVMSGDIDDGSASMEVVVVALDFLSGFAEGFEAAAVQYLNNENIPDILNELMKMANILSTDAKQTLFAVLGDFAKAGVLNLPPYSQCLPSWIEVLLSHLGREASGDEEGARRSGETLSVLVNTAWAIGEIVAKSPDDLARAVALPYLQRAVPLLKLLVQKKSSGTFLALHQSLVENIAVGMGRVTLKTPDLVSPHVTEFIREWLSVAGTIHDRSEKIDAFNGLLLAVEMSPSSVSSCFDLFLHTLAALRDDELPGELFQRFTAFIQSCRESVSQDSWNSLVATVDPQAVEILRRRHNLV